MAKEKKLELFEVLAAKRAQGFNPLGIEGKPARQANTPPPETEVTDLPGVIIDDAVSEEVGYLRQTGEDAEGSSRGTVRERVSAVANAPSVRDSDRITRLPTPEAPPPAAQDVPEAPPEPARPRTPREVVFTLDTALISFLVIMLLVASSYFIGYKRGEEERPAGLLGLAEIPVADPGGVNIRNPGPQPRAAMAPPEQAFTLIIRKEPASDELPERLELELAEALARGRALFGRDIPGFIFRTTGADPNYILAVGLGQAANDRDLGQLLKIYNDMEGIALSRQVRPYLGCRVAPIRELGTPVY